MKIDENLIGELVTVKFLDHSAFSDELCTCICAGWLVEIKEHHIVIAWWDILDEEDSVNRHRNQEHCSIITSSIKELKSYGAQ